MGLFSIKPKSVDALTKTEAVEETTETSAYCMKCKKTVVAKVSVEKKQTSKRLMTIYRGRCPVCNTAVTKFG